MYIIRRVDARLRIVYYEDDGRLESPSSSYDCPYLLQDLETGEVFQHNNSKDIHLDELVNIRVDNNVIESYASVLKHTINPVLVRNGDSYVCYMNKLVYVLHEETLYRIDMETLSLISMVGIGCNGLVYLDIRGNEKTIPLSGLHGVEMSVNKFKRFVLLGR